MHGNFLLTITQLYFYIELSISQQKMQKGIYIYIFAKTI